jgi:uncharacterized membrane protein
MIFDGLTLARAIHVLAIVHWIGGVSVVTTVVLPHVRRLGDAIAAVEAFEAFERRFARQARISILLAGLSGLYMLFALNAWDRLLDLSFWWIHLMVVVWLMFAIMVYVLEPLIVHDRFRRLALEDPTHAFGLAIVLHAFALAVSAIAIGAGVLGAHGILS